MVKHSILASAALCIILATACTPSTPELSTATSDPETLRPLDVAPSAPPDRGGGVTATDASGNVIKSLGEPGGLVAADGKTIILEVSAESVSRGTSCDGRLGTETSENGEFLFVEMLAELHADTASFLPSSTETSVPLTAESFRVVLADGTEHNDLASASAWGCLEDEVLMPLFLYPGENASGIVVLDAPSGAAVLIYDPYETGGWAWSLQ